MSDLVAEWDLALSKGVHKVRFEHGTTTGKRVITVDNKEIHRKDWMFKLVGKEFFTVSNTRCCITIDAVSGFAYEYTLEVNGRPLKRFVENQSKIMRTWVLYLGGIDTRVVLEKDTLDVWVNGKKMETAGEFVDDGTETHFEINNHSAYIKAETTGKRRDGIIHKLFVDDIEIPLAKE